MRNSLLNRDIWNTTREFSPWFQDIDEVMDRLLVPLNRWNTPNQNNFNPPAEIEETETHYLMSFDLPGIAKEDVKIEALENQISIFGERRSAKKEEKDCIHISERNYGSFRRSFTLPNPIDATKVEANYRDGVLQLAVPKAEVARPHQIKISEGKSSIFSKLLGHKQNVEKEVKESAETKTTN